jgi:hypothetical protein
MGDEKNYSDFRDSASAPLGSHPVATGVGAAGGAIAAGAAIGTVAGPVGTAVGAAAGAVVGAFTGKALAASIDPDAEDLYWRDNFDTRPYANAYSFDEYRPAYRYGVESYQRYPGRSFDDVEMDLSRDWDTSRGKSSLKWEHAKLAARDSWTRVSDAIERAVPGDSDRDGR